MDNAAFHRGPRVQKICDEASVKLLYYSLYSPDLNPVEDWFAQLKACYQEGFLHMRYGLFKLEFIHREPKRADRLNTATTHGIQSACVPDSPCTSVETPLLTAAIN